LEAFSLATLAELQTELAKVDAAIDRITGTTTAGGAQSIGVGASSVTRANLDTLYKRKRELQNAIDRKTNGASANPVFGVRA
jgi:hypothetical protein